MVHAVILAQFDSDQIIEEVRYTRGAVIEITVTAVARAKGVGQKLSEECQQRVMDAGVQYLITEV
jgi:hypothetical protein